MRRSKYDPKPPGIRPYSGFASLPNWAHNYVVSPSSLFATAPRPFGRSPRRSSSNRAYLCSSRSLCHRIFEDRGFRPEEASILEGDNTMQEGRNKSFGGAWNRAQFQLSLKSIG